MNKTIEKEYVASLIGTRRRDSHKGDHGKGLLIAGSEGFSGAAVMASASALRAGIGTLKVASTSGQKGAFYALSEAMFCDIGPSWDECLKEYLCGLIADAACIGIGPGMGRSIGVLHVLNDVLASRKPMVIDADGLNALASEEKKSERLHGKAVLTPHMGEMARLTGKSMADIGSHMVETARRYAGEWGCVVLLKGAKSVIASPDGRYMRNESGNCGLAKGGSGDVLCGIILALLGQGLLPFDAACAGAFLLGASADAAMELLRERMLMARDVIDMIEETLQWM